MTLSFPNQSRFYDATRRAEPVLGARQRDGGIVFVDADALKRIEPDMLCRARLDFSARSISNRKLIYATAAEVYERGHKGSYDHHNFSGYYDRM